VGWFGLETGPPKRWNAHNKPCAMKGNAPFAEPARFCARVGSRRLRIQKKGSDIA
jgi:hypothetical protein